MSATFTWSVATAEGPVEHGECEFMVVPTTGGELGLLAGHAALVACVAPGDLRITAATGERMLRVGAGLVDVRDNQVRLLVSGASVHPGSP
jgi:F-type H+-transporting ATPase subunit epsilon